MINPTPLLNRSEVCLGPPWFCSSCSYRCNLFPKYKLPPFLFTLPYPSYESWSPKCHQYCWMAYRTVRGDSFIFYFPLSALARLNITPQERALRSPIWHALITLQGVGVVGRRDGGRATYPGLSQGRRKRSHLQGGEWGRGSEGLLLFGGNGGPLE